MFDRAIAVDIAKRDAVRIFVERIVEWLDRQRAPLSGLEDRDKAYREGYNAALAHVRRHLLG